MKHVSLMHQVLPFLRPDAPSAATVQNITHNTMIGSSEAPIGGDATWTSDSGGMIRWDWWERSGIRSPQCGNRPYGTGTKREKAGRCKWRPGRTAKAVAKIKHFLVTGRCRCSDELTIAWGRATPAIARALMCELFLKPAPR